jgi:hypothetical protein
VAQTGAASGAGQVAPVLTTAQDWKAAVQPKLPLTVAPQGGAPVAVPVNIPGPGQAQRTGYATPPTPIGPTTTAADWKAAVQPRSAWDAATETPFQRFITNITNATRPVSQKDINQVTADLKVLAREFGSFDEYAAALNLHVRQLGDSVVANLIAKAAKYKDKWPPPATGNW